MVKIKFIGPENKDILEELKLDQTKRN